MMLSFRRGGWVDGVLAAEVDLLVAVGDAERVGQAPAAGGQVQLFGEGVAVDAAAWVVVDDADDVADERPVGRQAAHGAVSR
jgi:hypothetical protein